MRGRLLRGGRHLVKAEAGGRLWAEPIARRNEVPDTSLPDTSLPIAPSPRDRGPPETRRPAAPGDAAGRRTCYGSLGPAQVPTATWTLLQPFQVNFQPTASETCCPLLAEPSTARAISNEPPLMQWAVESI